MQEILTILTELSPLAVVALSLVIIYMLVVQSRFSIKANETVDVLTNNHMSEVLASLIRIESRLGRACDMLTVIYTRNNGKQPPE
jgi:uncharacterized membrane protein